MWDCLQPLDCNTPGFPVNGSMCVCVCVCAKSLQSCLTLCNPKDCSLPVSCVYGFLQVRILVWVAVPSSRGSSQPRDQTHVSIFPELAGGLFTTGATWEACPWIYTAFLIMEREGKRKLNIPFRVLQRNWTNWNQWFRNYGGWVSFSLWDRRACWELRQVFWVCCNFETEFLPSQETSDFVL